MGEVFDPQGVETVKELQKGLCGLWVGGPQEVNCHSCLGQSFKVHRNCTGISF